MTLLDLVGFVGLSLLLSSFILNQMKRMTATSLIYNIMNALGGYLLTYYAFMLDNVPFIILEFVWGSVSLYRILTYKRGMEDHTEEVSA